MADPDTYFMVAVFTRSFGDDSGVVLEATPDALAVQLAKELQPMYDEGAAGSFEITAVLLNGKTHLVGCASEDKPS